MAQKPQNGNSSEDQSHSVSRTSSAKDGAGTGTASSTRQSATSTTAHTNLNSTSNSSSSTNTNPASGSSSTVLPRMSDPAPKSGSNSESPQPMEKSSAAAPKDGTGSSTASPYGTRSRNRTGASRPNYAEDKDIDPEIFEDRRDGDSKKATTRQASSANAAQGAPRTSNGTTRKPLPPSDDSKQSTPQAAPKENPQSATTTPATNGHNNSNGVAKSKKRKAEPAPATSGSQTPNSSNAHSSAAQKRQGPVSQAGTGNPNVGSSGLGYTYTNMLTFDGCKARPKNGKMVADDGTVLEVNDHVYLVCEPPGEPYYLGRIMEFLYSKDDDTVVDALRMNWYYRPKEIGRKVQDTRLVFASMHSDISPLTSLRGKCQIRHKAEISNLAEYKRQPDSFWYEKLYDRYIQKNYEVIPTSKVINVPEHVKKVLDERWKFILVEQGRGKELTSAVKTCKRCTGYCASNDSVDCAVCHFTYHMNCVKPPLLKKPSRGFAWSCAACSRAQERKLEARNTPNLVDSHLDDEEEYLDDDEDDICGVDTGRTSPADEGAHQPATAEQIYHASLWPYRYLGIHCKVEDALDYDDRIFPRACTRTGPRHQAFVPEWYGRPVKYVKPLEIKRTGKKGGGLTKEMQAAIEAERIKRENRPKWIQDEPPGWIERGGDDTATLLYKPAEDCGANISDEAIDNYMAKATGMAEQLGLPPRSTNLQDVARDLLFRCEFDTEKALKELVTVPKADFKEPELTPAEVKKFEEGVAKFGSELHSVMKHVKTLSPATVVRYYYKWKKTEKGRQIWGNFAARKGKKDAKNAEEAAKKVADDVADSADDSAFDEEKARVLKKSFTCRFCGTKTSRQWRRPPNASLAFLGDNGGQKGNKDKNAQYIPALCRRCAEPWRRYAVQWEDVEELGKKVIQTGGRGLRKKVDEDLYKELVAADEKMKHTRFLTPDPAPAASPASSLSAQQPTQEPPRKKLKGLPEKDSDQTMSDSGSTASAPAAKKKDKEKEKEKEKEKPVEKPPPPPPVPEIPKPRVLPCFICGQMEPLGDQHVSCKECRMTVHRSCYGITDNRPSGKWCCDMCLNDKSPQVSIHYQCILCSVEKTAHDFVGPPKVSHKKKTDKDRERERQERENAVKAAEYYRKRQEEMNRPVDPREPLKRTADNNWVHVTCAVWTPEVKFGNAKSLVPCEGIPSIPRSRYAEFCKVCKKDQGACVSCHQCRAPMHVECARQAGHVLGFDITPVKGSRRDQVTIVSINNEVGTMSAAVWCKEHVPTKTIVHRMNEIVDENGTTALQLYVQNFKQADLTLTGCARKANQITLASKMSSPTSTPAAQPNRRGSIMNLVNGDHDHMDLDSPPTASQPGGKICLTCGVDTSPKWYPIDNVQERELVNGFHGHGLTEVQKWLEQRSFQCHKCKKAKRQPNPHPPPPKEPTPAPEPIRQIAQTPLAAPSPPPVPMDTRQPSRSSYGRPWSPPQQSAALPPPVGPPNPLQAPLAGAIVPSLAAPQLHPPGVPQALPPALAPRAAPVQTNAFAPPARPFDWHRPTTGHSAHPIHPRDMNGGPSPPPLSHLPALAPPNHLRPPAMTSLSHPPPPPPPPSQNGHMAQPAFVNGMPPSPRRLSGGPPPSQNGPSYMASPLHSHAPHHMLNPMPPVMQPVAPGPMVPDRDTSVNYLRPWQSPHHNSPPLSRDTIPHMGREPSIPPPQRENRPASGASASPSLKHLLS
ncbi:hypothetical protein V8F20_001579 [Naviculisporaceae sp. PSN 640]